MSSRRLFLALTLLPLAPLPLRAQTPPAQPTPESARALEQQMDAWLATTLGPDVKLNRRPVQITADGDHYDVSVPFGDAPDAPHVTATAHQLDGGRWSIDDIKAPSPLEFHLNMPVPGADDQSKKVTNVPVTYHMTFGQQAGQIVFDPSYATTSTSNSSVGDFSAHAIGAGLEQQTHIDKATTNSVIRPAGSGRVDAVTTSTVDGYTIDSTIGDKPPVRIGIAHADINGELDGVSPDRVGQVVRAIAQFGASMQAAAPGSSAIPKPPTPKASQELLAALQDLAQGGSVDETLNQVSLRFGSVGGTLHTARIGMAAKSDAGLLDGHIELGAEGLALPDLQLGPMAELIPTRVTIRPAVAGLPIPALQKLIDDSQGGATPPPADIEALFSHGGFTVGLENLAVDVAGASISGTGKLVFASAEQFTGTAQLGATNFDLLQQRVAAQPELAQAAPVFIFLKGIGRTVDNRMVWDVNYGNGRLVVNGQDLTAMLGAGDNSQGGPKAPPHAAPNRPTRRQ